MTRLANKPVFKKNNDKKLVFEKDNDDNKVNRFSIVDNNMEFAKESKKSKTKNCLNFIKSH